MRNRYDASSGRITKTVDAGLCHSCGACQAVCPVDAICFRETVGGHFYPVIDECLCTQCGLCLKVCAGMSANTALARVLPPDPFSGSCLESWVGRSTDANVYRGGQSGGVVSQLLIDLLNSGEVDGCAVVKMVPGNPPRPTAFLARNKQEILEAQKSKYCPVPVLGVLREIERTNDRIAMVGLACHFHGLSLIEDAGVDLASEVKLKIGLVCDRTLTLAAVDHLVEEASHRGKSAQLVFRDKPRTGYPGDVTVQDGSGNVSVLPNSERMAIKDAFTPARCRLCFDKMNVLADVTVGDPWGVEGADKQDGESVVIARTEAGLSALAVGLSTGHLSLRPIDHSEILRGQDIGGKSADWRAYCEAWREMGQKVPSFYDSIGPHAPLSARSPREYRRKLRMALQLDRCRSREAVLEHARKAVMFRQARQQLSWALGRARHLLCRGKEKEAKKC
ncbi:MAG: Coenzyme F420 hydrogenase/dehydrogenase, beta subunit C-terminal domain [Chloroflexota bacterium]